MNSPHPTKLMTHLVANYPNPELFEQALGLMLSLNIDFVEIQLPFSNPLADGKVIYKANQTALSWPSGLDNILAQVSKVKADYPNSTTQLLLMSYITPILNYGLEKLSTSLFEAGFVGTILPDLMVNSPEEKQLREYLHSKSMYNLPVISPLTSEARMQTIIQTLLEDQPIYAMSRKGRTGKPTEIESIQEYLDTLKSNLEGYQIAVGFGISTKSQVEFLNNQGIIAVIGSKIVNILQAPDFQISQLGDFLNSINNTL
jgi:tryptophan synthase alpha chain